MNETNSDFAIYPSKTKMLLSALFFFVFGIIFFRYIIYNERLQEISPLLSWLGWFVLLVNIFIAIALVSSALKHKPLLKINNKGLTYNDFFRGRGSILWDQVTALGIIKNGKSKELAIIPKKDIFRDKRKNKILIYLFFASKKDPEIIVQEINKYFPLTIKEVPIESLDLSFPQGYMVVAAFAAFMLCGLLIHSIWGVVLGVSIALICIIPLIIRDLKIVSNIGNRNKAIEELDTSDQKNMETLLKKTIK
ncbi:MAG: hypothetical protein NT145_03740 [Elusimicrobia bacterium]|nr:hypothetical protein [Elusimicrobiota bacterium]